jgi:hypothetical protein
MPIPVDVIALIPEGWGLCQSCEALMARAELDKAPAQRGLDDLPAEWQAEFGRLSALVFDLAHRYRDQLRIRIYDPRSLPGLAKALRFRVRRYPTFVIDGRRKVVGCEQEALEQAVCDCLGRRVSA